MFKVFSRGEQEELMLCSILFLASSFLSKIVCDNDVFCYKWEYYITSSRCDVVLGTKGCVMKQNVFPREMIVQEG